MCVFLACKWFILSTWVIGYVLYWVGGGDLEMVIGHGVLIWMEVGGGRCVVWKEMTEMLACVSGPPWWCPQPQLQAVPIGLGVPRTLLQRPSAVTHPIIGLSAPLLSTAIPAAAIPPEPGPLLPCQRPLLLEPPTPAPAAPLGAAPEAGCQLRHRISPTPTQSLSAPTVWTGPQEGLPLCPPPRCPPSLWPPWPGLRHGGWLVPAWTWAPWHGRCSGTSQGTALTLPPLCVSWHEKLWYYYPGTWHFFYMYTVNQLYYYCVMFYCIYYIIL